MSQGALSETEARLRPTGAWKRRTSSPVWLSDACGSCPTEKILSWNLSQDSGVPRETHTDHVVGQDTLARQQLPGRPGLMGQRALCPGGQGSALCSALPTSADGGGGQGPSQDFQGRRKVYKSRPFHGSLRLGLPQTQLARFQP